LRQEFDALAEAKQGSRKKVEVEEASEVTESRKGADN
jgi:hypothetical protein